MRNFSGFTYLGLSFIDSVKAIFPSTGFYIFFAVKEPILPYIFAFSSFSDSGNLAIAFLYYSIA